MKGQGSVSSRVVLIPLFVAVVVMGLSLFFFWGLGQIVHGDLYNYGLSFDAEWATKYMVYSRWVFIFSLVSLLVTGISISSVLTCVRSGRVLPRFLIFILLSIGVTTASVSLFFFTYLDHMVHGDLYNYGLQFSPEWAIKYWNYSEIFVSSVGIEIVAFVLSILIVLLGQSRTDVPKMTFSAFFSTGLIVLFSSIILGSTVLATIGLGLIFWAAILLYIRPGAHVKAELLAGTALPPLVNLEQILQEIGYHGKGVYLPPEYLKDPNSSKAYLATEEHGMVPSKTKMKDHEDKTFLKDSALITPPGSELLKLFEKNLGLNFAKVDLSFLKFNLPKLLTTDFQIAEKVEFEIRKNTVHVKIEDTVLQTMWKEAEKLTRVWSSLGYPLVSAIACAIAKATGKPTVIERNQLSHDRDTIEVEYRLLGD